MGKINSILNKLCDDDYHGAMEEWELYRIKSGSCDHCRSRDGCNTKMLCASVLQSYLLACSLGGEDELRQLYFSQAKKLEKWITKQSEDNEYMTSNCSAMNIA